MDPFVKKIQNFVFHKNLFCNGGRIVVGISGGPDSTALVRALDQLATKHQLELSLVHVNYGLRGKDSDEDEKFVRKLSDALGLPLDVAAFHGKKEGNLEEKLRDFRYRKFEKIRKEKKFDLIATGHTLDDQAETVLMNMVRGAGLKGLGGIRAKREKIIRPLLAFEKKEVLEFLVRLGQDFRIDRSNLDERLLRNRLRLKLTPMLEREYNPKIKKALANLASQAEQTGRLVEQIAKSTYNEIGRQEKNEVAFKLAELNKLAPALKPLVVRHAIDVLCGNKKDATAAHLFEIEKILTSAKPKNHKFNAPMIVVERKGNKVIFTRK